MKRTTKTYHAMKVMKATLPLRKGLLALCLCITFSAMHPVTTAQASERTLALSYNNAAHMIVIEGRGKGVLKAAHSKIAPRELLLTFSDGINVSSLDELVTVSGGTLHSVSNGYDTLLIRTAIPSLFTVEQKNNSVYVTIAKDKEAPVEIDDRARLRLQLLEARLLRETGDVHESRLILNRLLEQYPDDYRVHVELAATELYLENWRGALTYFDQAHELAPMNEDITESRKHLWDYHRPRVKLDHEWEKRGSDTDFHITTAEGFTYIKPYTRVGIVAQNNNYQTGTIRRADGRIKSNSGNRHREEVYVRHDYADGDMAKVSLFTGYNALGAGAEYKLVDRYGDTTFIAEFGKANWDYIEGVVDGANRDSLGFMRRFPLTPLWDARIGSGFNRYNIDGEDGVAETVSLDGELRYQIRQQDPLVTVGYVLDAEYRTDEKTAVDGQGATYLLLPISSREIHFLDVSFYKELNLDWILQGFAGYGYDRILGDGGPSVGGSLTYGVHENLEAQLRASHTLGTDGTNDATNRLGGYVMWKF